MNPDVVLVNPNRMQPPIAPLALDYLAEALENAGLAVGLLDLCFSEDPDREIENYFRGNEPRLIGVTVRNTDDVYFVSQDFCLDKYAAVIDATRRCSDAPIVLGGAGYSVFPEAILDYLGLDLGIWGEGEDALPLLAKRIRSGEDLSGVPALVHRGRDGVLRRNPARRSRLDKIPALRRTAVDNARYFQEGGQIGIEAKRGCGQLCHYCADIVGKGPLVTRPARVVVEEMRGLLDRGIDHFHFCDSEFNLPASHACEVCRELICLGLGGKLRWYAYCSPVPFSKELAEAFLKAGCAGINFGADSGSDAMLRRLGRNFTAADVEATARICREEGLNFMYDLLLGGPGETRDSLKETIDLMKRISPARVGVSLGVRLFPGTRLMAEVQAEGLLMSNPNVRGRVTGNPSLLAPIFYLADDLAPDGESYLAGLIGEDQRFFFASSQAGHESYNYNDNSVLVQAIKNGERGAYWDILRRLKG